jgi:nucleolar protein 56
MATTYILSEAASGYSLYEVVQFEEIGGLIESAQETVTELQRFERSVKLKAFSPFTDAHQALENITAISEHEVCDTLKVFLERELPKVKKGSKSTAFKLGVVEAALATAINEALGAEITFVSDTVREVLRGIRCHESKMVPMLGSESSQGKTVLMQSQTSLGHAYSRLKVKFNPARSDNMVIQSIALLDQLEKDLNTFSMRIREWYSYSFPELKAIVKDNYQFARCAALIQDKMTLTGTEAGEKIAKLAEILGEQEQADQVVAAAKTSMGMECSQLDMINVINFTQRIVKLAEYRKQLSLYLSDKMSIVAPNLSALIGDTVAARLISKAGSLTSLAKAPASTVQILGAEKALFRALKTKGNTPKYGLIYHSSFISRAEAKNKGRISRYLANKCSIASRIDTFSDEPSSAYGEKLHEQVEERLKFYETGKAPRKNKDVMEEVKLSLQGASDAMVVDNGAQDDLKKKKKDKKEKKRKAEEAVEEVPASEKKAKKEKKEKKPKKSAAE